MSEAERLPIFSYTAYSYDPSPLTSLFLAAFFGALLAVKYFRSSAKRTPAVLIALLALALSATMVGILIPAGYLDPWICNLCDTVHSMLWPVFLYVWVREMLPLGYSYTIQSFALGLITVAALNFLSMAMNTVVAIVIIALLPLISAFLLMAVKAPEHSYASEVSFPHCGETDKKQRLQFLMFTIIPLACFAIVFGNIHLSWNTLQDGSTVSLIVQLGVATGTLLAGLGVYGLYAIGTLRKYTSIVMLILIAFTLFSIWLSSYTNGNLVFLYAAFLNVAQKGVFMLIFLALFRGPWHDPLFGWSASMCAFLYGTYVSSLIMYLNTEMILVAFAVISACLLIVSSVAMLVNDIDEAKLYHPTSANNSVSGEFTSESFHPTIATDPAIPAPEIQPAEVSASTSPATSEVTPPVSVPSTDTSAISYSKDDEYLACMRLTQEFSLTRREADVLSLLIHGRTAEPIAKTLGISHATAKTHLRNIYNKLGVHTQQEVIDLMEAYTRKD